MTRRSRRLVLFALTAGLPVALIAAWLVWPRTAITRENAAQIREGMTRSEVEAILGRTPIPRPTDRKIWHRTPNGAEMFVGDYWWEGDMVVIVAFDDAGKVRETQTFEVPDSRRRDTFLDKVRRWLHL
jgi:SmpA / OmlA family